MLRLAVLIALIVSSAALAQPAITIDVENPVLLPGESTVVRMYGGYGGTDYAVAGVQTNLVSSVGSTGWGSAALLDPMDAPGTQVGGPSTTGWDGIFAGQLHFPEPGAGIYADPTNPIAFWQAIYTAPLDPNTPFDIDLSTMTTRYDVYIGRERVLSESRLADLTEGAATIRVIPSPASTLVLALGLAALRRRREPDRVETRDA